MRILRRGHSHLKPETLSEYLDGRPGRPVASRVEEETARCPVCRDELESLTSTVMALRSMPRAVSRRDFTLAGPPPGTEGVQRARPATPFRMPRWVYVGAAAVLVLALLLSGGLSSLLFLESSAVEEQASGGAPMAAVEVGPSGDLAVETGAPSSDEPQMANTPARKMPSPESGMALAAAGADAKPEKGAMEAKPTPAPTRTQVAPAEESSRSGHSMMATVPPSPTAPPPSAASPIAMAAVQETAAQAAVAESSVAKEVVKEAMISGTPSPVPPAESGRIAGPDGSADDSPKEPVRATRIKPDAATQKNALTLPVPHTADPMPILALSPAAATSPGATPTPTATETQADGGPASTATPAGHSPGRADLNAGATLDAPNTMDHSPVPAPTASGVAPQKREQTSGAEAMPEPVSQDSGETPASPPGILWPALLGFCALAAAILATSFIIGLRLSRRRSR